MIFGEDDLLRRQDNFAGRTTRPNREAADDAQAHNKARHNKNTAQEHCTVRTRSPRSLRAVEDWIMNDFTLLSDDDLYLFNEGTHVRLYRHLGLT